MRRLFVESRGFSADRERLERAGELTLEDLVRLEQDILANPGVGDLVPGTGGLRKVGLDSGRYGAASGAAFASTTWTSQPRR